MESMASSFTPWCRIGEDGELLSSEAVRSVCVIGAGSSGLVAAKHLRDAGLDVTVFERSRTIGGAFVSKAYDDSRLVSSTYLTAFSDLRCSGAEKPHMLLTEYAQYLEEYTDRFGLRPLIEFATDVLEVLRDGDGYSVRTKAAEAFPVSEASSEQRRFDAVCVCCGLHEVPHVPAVAGADSFTGRALHSSEYKEKSTFRGQRVLVVGCGESGMDLAYRAVQEAEETALSIKRGFLAVPHDGWGGMPLDTLICNVLEHSYEHWWCHRTHLKWKLTTYIIRIMFFLATGTSAGYSQWTGCLPDVKRGHHILCKSTAALPYLNRPLKQRSFWRRLLWRWVEPEVHRSIHSFPAPAKIEGKQVTFVDGRTLEVDLIVWATGYRQRFPFLDALHADRPASADRPPRAAEQLAPAAPPPAGARDGVSRRRVRTSPAPRRPTRQPADGRSASHSAAAAAKEGGAAAAAARGAHAAPACGGAAAAGPRGHKDARGVEDPLPSDHFIIDPQEPRLAFIGFVRPNVGAIPPMAELQVMWWLERLRGRIPATRAPPSYGLLGKKLKYGVDYGNYMHQLAAEFGASPSLWVLLRRSPRALCAYTLGQAYVSFFRLQGPFMNEDSWRVASTELYAPVLQRGLFTNFIFIVTMLAFGLVSLIAFLIERTLLALPLPAATRKALLEARAGVAAAAAASACAPPCAE